MRVRRLRPGRHRAARAILRAGGGQGRERRIVRDGVQAEGGAEAAQPATAALLRRLMASHAAPRFSLGDLMDAFGERGFSLIFLALALPNTLPVPGPPVSALFGIPTVIVAWQMARGLPEPLLPGWLRRWSIPAAAFRRLAGAVLPCLDWIEARLRPRPGRWPGPRGERMVGAAVLGLGVVLATPLPLANYLAAVSIAAVAIGHLERDRRALWVGALVAALMLLWLAVLAFAGLAIVNLLAAWLP